MNKRIKNLIEQATTHIPLVPGKSGEGWIFDKEKFAKLIISEVLDEVNERAYYCGDRAWSDDDDRKWIELEFGYGELADKQNERKNQRTR